VARILIIDDECLVRSLLRQTLERAGHDVVEAKDGREGLRSFRITPADLIITDILMPEKEGLETIIELRRDIPGVKIIAMSGGRGGKLNFLDIAKQLGAQRVIQKPFEVYEMLKAVTELLEEV